jgi:hypothetical protein
LAHSADDAVEVGKLRRRRAEIGQQAPQRLCALYRNEGTEQSAVVGRHCLDRVAAPLNEVKKDIARRQKPHPSPNETHDLVRAFRIDVPDRRTFAQLRVDRDALQRRVKDLKTELAMLRERHSYGKP